MAEAITLNKMDYSPYAQRAKNFISSIFFLSIAYIFYTKQRYYKNFFSDKYYFPFLNASISLFEVFKYLFFIYAICLFLIYFLEKSPKTGKGVYAMIALKKIFLSPIRTFKHGLPKEEKISLLAIFVKIFFTPLMISWFFSNSSKIIQESGLLLQNKHLFLNNFILLFQQHMFWMLFNLILLIDVFFFGIGYLIELPILKNTILSVEPSLLGWIVTLICYPPFNFYANKVITWKSTDFPYFSNPYLFLTINIMILALMGVYSWASISLGFKASNLTHRGIVTKGPYKFIRHPAYVCKNLAWWLGGLPLMIYGAKEGIISILLVVLSLSAWSFIYFLRATTEERHLKSVNSEYEKYMEKVPYRFVPFVA